MPKRKPTQVVQVPVRMKEYLRAELEKAAKGHGASLNGEIVGRLEQSFVADDQRKMMQQVVQDIMNDMFREIRDLREKVIAGGGDLERWVFYTDTAGKHRWRRISDMKVVAESEKGYATEEESLASATRAGWVPSERRTQ